MIRAAKLLVVAVWLLTVGWLIRFEAFPELFSGSTLSYRSLIGQNVLMRESWHKISLKGKDIGYISTSISSEDSDSSLSFQITSKTHINLGLPVTTDDIILETSIVLDTAYNLSSMNCDLRAPGITVRNTLQKLDSGKFRATSHRTDLQSDTTEDLSLPATAIVFIPPTDLLPQRLRAGVKSYMRVLDPISLTTSVVELDTVTPNQSDAPGLDSNQHWTKMTHKGMDFYCTRNNKDEVISVSAPLGIRLTRCTPDEAFTAAGMGANAPPALELDPEKVTQYVESLVGPLSSVISLKPAMRKKDND